MDKNNFFIDWADVRKPNITKPTDVGLRVAEPNLHADSVRM